MRGIEETIERLINSGIIKDWIILFQQKMKNTKLRNSVYMNSHREVEKVDYLFVDEDKKLCDIEEAKKEIMNQSQKREKKLKEYQKATDKNNQKLMKKLENKIANISEKIECLFIKIEDKKDKVKELEEKRCKLLKDNQVNEKELALSKEDRAIRDVENEIWKIILDDYFKDKNDKVLILKEYEQYCKKFKKIFTESVKATTDNDKKNNDALLNIVATLYNDVSRDKLFLQRENIITDGWEEIKLKCHSVTAIDVQNQFATSKFYI